MKHTQVVGLLRIAGYHEDQRMWARVYVEHRVSLTTARNAYAEGQAAKKKGIRCSCHTCAGKPL